MALRMRLEWLCRVCVVLPMRTASGASSSLSWNKPYAFLNWPMCFIVFNATPTDCVHLGPLMRSNEDSIDMVVRQASIMSANLGAEVLYSGTVAASTGRAFFANAQRWHFSLVGRQGDNMNTAGADCSAAWWRATKALDLAPRTILNVKHTNLPWTIFKGIRLTRARHPFTCGAKRGEVVASAAQGGATGPYRGRDAEDGGEGTDFTR